MDQDKRSSRLATINEVRVVWVQTHSATIRPGGTAKFMLSSTDMRENQDSRTLRLITPQLVKPIVFEFLAEAKVTRTQDLRNLRQFAKANSSIEDKLSIEYDSIKINRHTVGLGNNHPRIAFVEPFTHRPSVANILMRPAAIPAANLPKKTGGAGASLVKGPPVATRPRIPRTNVIGERRWRSSRR
ncbi:hypothetical protein AMAG_13761 [Allomyces macrogynus ATCC 38327]|uniref:Uncharacterized protein n=1 Tax=Allomyces macrogynus (strain ATCC 38327) TaxID=578462 RepID=A0A0L0T3U7_ALLM3|nr:hypothetical protein AMAG_13761 [Allomyces macrogynus ATCC 38327]|eukprot:KNE69396.1 hypothetical protein AMAG_13761 [Allomyces macrogynus ATCC 38327]